MLLLFGLCLLVAQLALPWRLACVPLLIAACHLGNEQVFASLTVVRLLIMAGLARAYVAGRLCKVLRFQHPLDRLMLAFACWAVLSSFGHVKKEGYNPLTVHLSLTVDYLATYLFARAYLRKEEDMIQFARSAAWVLLPLALFLTVEKMTGRNVYGALGATYAEAWVREGKVRAAGPFGNAILAGTVGGVFLPLMVYLRRPQARLALAGMAACGMIVFCSASSGPVMTLIAGLGGVALWRWRRRLGQIRKGVLALLILLAVVMNAPIWYLIARIDIAGGSTSWHRAELIQQAVNHFSEWWLVGTDYTRHWMPYGIQWSKDHVDITNHYINLGVRGGLLLMALFIAIVVKAFQMLGRRMKQLRKDADETEHLLWCVGAILFAHAFTFMAVSYFDQSYVFFCLIVGAVPGLCAVSFRQDDRQETAIPESRQFSAG